MASSVSLLNDILSEGWLHLLQKKGKTKEQKWKKYFFVMKSTSKGVLIELFKKPPKTSDKSVVSHTFNDYHHLHKKDDRNNKEQPYLCEVTDPNTLSIVIYGFDKEARRDSLAFFLITQRSLPPTPSSGKLFQVMPDNTDSFRKIGARGSKCILHICKSGLTLAFHSSRCIIAQWPLNSVRNFESTGKGHFQIEGGRRSPMGEGIYRFSTLIGQDSEMYSLMDRYITETLQSMQAARSRDDKIYEEYCSLRAIAQNVSESRFTQQLKRASESCFRDDSSFNGDAQAVLNEDFLPQDEHKISDIERAVGPMTIPKIARVKSNTVETEDPLSLSSYDDTACRYLDMSGGSTHNLDVLTFSPRDTKPSSRDLKSEFSIPIDEGLSPRSSRATSIIKSPSCMSQASVITRRMDSFTSCSPSLAMSPPPSFYEATRMPGYPAPSRPISGLISNSPSSRISARQRSVTLKSAGSCEDLTDYIRDNLILSPTRDWPDYENALFSNDLLHEKETFTESLTLPPKLRTKDVTQQVKSTAGCDDSYVLGDQEAGDNSPRVTSVYLLDKPELPPKKQSKLKVNLPSASLSDSKRTRPTASPYIVTELSSANSNFSEANIFFHKAQTPPKIPASPRPLLLKKRAHTVDICDVEGRPTTVTSSNPHRKLSFNGVNAGYEQVDLPGHALLHTVTADSNRMSTVYEPINVDEMLKKTQFKEPTTIWHISLDDEVIDNPLPPDDDLEDNLDGAIAICPAQMKENDLVSIITVKCVENQFLW